MGSNPTFGTFASTGVAPLADLFGFVARFYDRFASRPQADSSLQDLAAARGQRLLDLGGGTGRMAQFLQAGGVVVVCDLSPGMLAQAQRKGLLACRGRAEALPFAPGAFDTLLVVDAFHHFADQEAAAREMLRVLRPDGRLMLIEPDMRWPLMPLVSLGERLLGLPSRILRPEELASLLSACGGQVAGVKGESGLRVSLLVRKPSSPPPPP